MCGEAAEGAKDRVMPLSAVQPCRVSLLVGDEACPAVALEMSGHRAAITSARALSPRDRVRVHLDWSGGSSTSLPALVQAVAPAGAGVHLAHVEFCAVDGDWKSFLAYLGPTAIAS
jgi:hypothetical protein